MVREDIETIIRQKLLERERDSVQKDPVYMGQYPELLVRWISDQKLQEERVGSSPAEVAASLMRHKSDGEVSVCTTDGMKVLIAQDGYVLMARDMNYWRQLNDVLRETVCESAADHTEDMGMGGCKPPRYAADPANQVNSHSPI